jgi:hypothetical protein
MEVLHPAAAEDGRRALPRRSISPKMSPTCENLSGSDDDITAIETGRRESRGGSAKTVPFPGAAAGTRKSTGAARLARQRPRTGFSPFPRFAFFEVWKTWDFFVWVDRRVCVRVRISDTNQSVPKRTRKYQLAVRDGADCDPHEGNRGGR